MTACGANAIQLWEAILVRIRIGDDIESLSWDEWEARVRTGRINADTLVQFEPVTGAEFRRAAELEMYRSLRSSPGIGSAFFSSKPPLLTALMLGVLIRFHWMGRLPEVDAWLGAHWIRENAAIFEDGEGWRLLTSGLLHGNWGHLFSNSLWLLFASYNLERTLGRANLAVIFVASVAAGSVLSSLIGPGTPSLGASGGVYGLIAAMVTVAFARPDFLNRTLRLFFVLTSLPYMVWMFLNGLWSDQIDNAAHFGGLVTGLVLGVILVPEEVQHRAGDNARARAGILELCGLAMLVPWLAGPVVEPLQLAVERRAKVPYVQSLMVRWGLQKPKERMETALQYWVPASWLSSFDATRSSAFASTAGNGTLRAWRVSERKHDAIVDLNLLASEWVEEVREDWPNAVIEGPLATELADREGLMVTAKVGLGAEARVLEWRGVNQGIWSLESLWQVEPERVVRMAPLHRRLLGRIAWQAPLDLQHAETEIAAFPNSPKAQFELARQQIRAGQWEAGVEGLWAYVQAKSDSPRRWLAGLEDVRPALHLEPNPDRWFEGALENAPLPKVLEEVVAGLTELDRTEEAVGLLELAWRRSPGDRRIRRMRRRMGLPRELDSSTGRPWEEVHDPLTGQRRPALEAPEPLTLAAAKAEGARHQTEVAERTHQLTDWLANEDGRAWRVLLFLRTGRSDDPTDDDVDTLLDELRQAANGRTFPWLPEAVAEVLTTNPNLLQAVRRAAEAG
ncbi:MAG: rhomboid family intramembrane serine protease [Myxococcota bacterium]